MILVDTSVWIDHFRNNNKKLITLLLNDQVLTYSLVVGELACGNIKNRKETLDLLQKLPRATEASFSETLTTIEHYHLYGKGLGWIDIHLLAATKLSSARLWSLDKVLAKQAENMKISF